MHFRSAIWLFPASLMVRTASSISARVVMPVERVIGFPLGDITDEREVNDLKGGVS